MNNLRDILDLTIGFVLNQTQALAYIKECAGEVWAQAVKGETDIEDAKYIMDDLATMAHRIYAEDWDWVRFYECPMSASGINIKEVADK